MSKQKRSDRSHRAADGTDYNTFARALAQADGDGSQGFPLRPGRSVPPEPEDRCSCSHLLTQKARTHEGSHHDEACVLWCLPEYDVFQPDE